MVSGVIQTLESTKTPQAEEIQHFSGRILDLIEEGRGSDKYRRIMIQGYSYEAIENPFLKGVSLSILETIGHKGKEISLLPIMVSEGNNGIVQGTTSEIFLDKSKRIVLRYSSNKDLVGFSISDFRLVTLFSGDYFITEELIDYSIDLRNNTVKAKELELRTYTEGRTGGVKTHVLQRSVKNNTDYSDERLFQRIGDKSFLRRSERENIGTSFSDRKPYRLFDSKQQVLITRPVVRGEEVTTQHRAYEIEKVIEDLARQKKGIVLYVEPHERSQLEAIHRGGMSLPIFAE
jgi:hypothetical protein